MQKNKPAKLLFFTIPLLILISSIIIFALFPQILSLEIKYILIGINILAIFIVAISFFLAILKPANDPEKQLMIIKDSLKDFSGILADFGAGNLVTKISTTNLVEISHLKDNHSNPTAKKALKHLQRSFNEFNMVTSTPCQRISFSGNNSYQEGEIAGEATAKYMLKKGEVAVLLPEFAQANHALRTKGFVNLIKEKYPNIRIVEVIETTGQQDTAKEITKELIKKYPNLSMIYDTDGFSPVGVCKGIIECNKEKSIGLITYDVIKENIEYMDKGIIRLLMAQNGVGQSYNALVNLYNALEVGWRPVSKKMIMTPFLLDQNNYKDYWVNGKRELTEHEKNELVIPSKRLSNKPYKFGFLLPQDGIFFDSIVAGAKKAKEELAELNVEITIFNVFDSWDNFGSLDVIEPYIKKMEEEGYDGYATVILDPRVVNLINKSVEKGLYVTTYNSEPLNFRELIINVSDNINLLTEHSETLAAAAVESSRANEQISSSIVKIEEGIERQNGEVNKTQSELTGLSQNIEEINFGVKNYSSSIDTVTSISKNGLETVTQSNKVAEELKAQIGVINQSMEELNEQLNKIQTIVVTLEDFSSKTNVLAINASIQASRAGDAGKAFGVVASEVRTLAEQSNIATDNIKQIIGGILIKMQQVVNESSHNFILVDDNQKRFSEAQIFFEQITGELTDNQNEINNIQKAMTGLSNTSQLVKNAMETVDSMNQNNVDSVQSIAESIKEINVQSQDLSLTANKLLEMGQNQNVLFSQLNLKED